MKETDGGDDGDLALIHEEGISLPHLPTAMVTRSLDVTERESAAGETNCQIIAG